MRLTLRFFTLFIVCSMLPACSDEDGVNGPVAAQLWDIVTYEGPRSGNAGSLFTFRQVNDSPLITLTSDKTLQEVESGSRMMIRYIPENGEAYTDGPINLLSASRINNGKLLTEWKTEYNQWDRDKVFIYSAWRTGDYINFHLRLTYSTEPRVFSLVLDPATRDAELPELYLVHIMAEPTDYHDRAYFASFDISEIWNTQTAKGIKIHVSDTNLNKEFFTFYKSN